MRAPGHYGVFGRNLGRDGASPHPPPYENALLPRLVGEEPLIRVILIVQLALGPAIVGWLASQQTLLQTAAADRYRGRVFGAVGTTTSLMALIAIGLGSALGAG